MRLPFDDTDVVAASDEEDAFPDPLDLLNTSVIQSSPTTANTSIYEFTSKFTVPQHHELSQPPIAILPGAAESAPSSPHPGPSRAAALTKAADNHTPNTSIIAKGPPKPRPRPRPAYKIPPPADTAQSSAVPAASLIMSNIAPSTLPAPTVKSIIQESSLTPHKGKEKQSGAVDDSIDSYSLDIAERTKMRSRGKNSKAIPDDDIIELSSGSEDELSLLPPSITKPTSSAKKKGKEKGRASPTHKSLKRKKVMHDMDSTLATLPIPTSDPAPSSQLPPSDPPLPSSSNAAPPTDLHNSHTLSSPLLASRKRKRAGAVVLDDDEDDYGNNGPAGLAAAYSGDLMPPPPPPMFFASSSSSASRDVPADEHVLELPTEPKKKAKKKAANDDEDDWEGEPKPKPKPKGKTKAAVDDGGESDWTAEKPKAKPKPRARPKKKAPEPVGEGTEASAEPKPKAKRPARKMKVVVEVTSPRKQAPPSADANKHDESRLTAPPAPVIPESEESELSILESDLERGGPSSKGTKPSDTTKSSSLGKSGASAVSKSKGKGKKRVLLSDDEDELVKNSSPPKKTKRKSAVSSPLSELEAHPLEKEAVAEEPDQPVPSTSAKKSTLGSKELSSSPEEPAPQTPAPKPLPSVSSASGSSRVRTVIPKNTPMSELLRKVNSAPGSPFASSRPVHSPYLKSSKSMLRRIAPLHPHRRTPPPPPPRPPPPKKTKKQLEREEKWEMELEDTVEGWYCLPEEERAALRRAKRDAEMGFDD
ncbi:hypothetical protein PHLGIDRAFT_196025 [Phlebiopsis gigantea 11061_1 CR5-6]|uniref:Uncharacterized protein n=1 Tax=Phlebiopsis gigantea (strain 11061_1 CR5-6) TaxID=745531 RepID=A0A0C3NHT9_PHLG1|nr:hypothetical protein PHLGIDRAFT_196025 [Phlebiopsis gigantea 11061_1 CR5-6]